MFNLCFLKTFVSIAKTNSFRIAAEENNITQPGASNHIVILEKKLGAVLFERTSKKIHLTEAGKAFLPYAKGILKQYEEAGMAVQETLNKYCGIIKVATIYSIGLHDLQPIVKRFLRKYPNINIHIEYRPNSAIYQMILERTVDFGLVAFPTKRPGIVSRVFFENKLVLIQSCEYPVTKNNTIPLSEINNLPFVSFSIETPTGAKIMQFFKTNRIQPKIAHSYDNIEVLKRAVEVGTGCAFVPKSTIAHELENNSLKIINIAEKPNFVRPLGILYAKNKIFNKSYSAFFEMVINHKPKTKAQPDY